MKNLFLTLLLLPLFCNGQTITTIAGNGSFTSTGDGGTATAATFHGVSDVYVSQDSSIFITEYIGGIRKIDRSGIVSTVAGSLASGYSGDGGSAKTARLYNPISVITDNIGAIYIEDLNNHCIRKVDTSGIITTIAGTGTSHGFAGDGGPATAAKFYYPNAIRFDRQGNLVIADGNNSRIRKIDSKGVISTIAGTGSIAHTGDGGPATAAELFAPSGLCYDASGNLYLSEYSGYIRKIDTLGVITTIAGIGIDGYSGDGGPATAANLRNPWGIVVDQSGNIFIDDRSNNVIRKINKNGIISTVVGTGAMGYGGDGGPATAAFLYGPLNLALDHSGNMYIGDEGNYRIRKVACITTPDTAVISGVSATCAGDSIILTTTIPGGTWSSNATAIATVSNTGIVKGVTGGVVVISYSFASHCGIIPSSFVVTINSLPVSGIIKGVTNICIGDTTVLTDSATGGSWSSSNTGIANISSTGVLAAISTGTAEISYSVANSCGISFAITTVTVNPLPTSGAITGIFTVCVGATNTFSNTIAGGTWSSSDTSIATINSSGVVTGISAGTADVSYSVVNSCGTSFAIHTVTISPLPSSGLIMGIFTVCIEAANILSDAVAGGTWVSSDTSIATINSAGILTGISAGTCNISYLVTNSCGTAVTMITATVNPLPFAGSITGSDTICLLSDTIALSNAVLGGTWLSANSNAVVSSGIVSGLAIGTDTVFYIVTNMCGSDTAFHLLNIVNCLPPTAVHINQLSKSFELFPNPVKTSLTVFASNKITGVEITDIIGKRVFIGYYNDKKVSIDATDLSPGVYFVKINGSVIKKFVKD